MILTGPAIRAALARGDISIAPLIDNDDDSQVAQASVDLHLHPRLLRCETHRYEPTLFGAGMSVELLPLDVRHYNSGRFVEETMRRDAFLLLPGQLYLGATIERIRAPRHVAVIDGKSSLARLGVQVHLTAGYIEPGFHGQITLEIVVTRPIFLPPGWPIAQIRFHETTGEIECYTERGRYADAARTDGPQPSRSHLHKPRHV